MTDPLVLLDILDILDEQDAIAEALMACLTEIADHPGVRTMLNQRLEHTALDEICIVALWDEGKHTVGVVKRDKVFIIFDQQAWMTLEFSNCVIYNARTNDLFNVFINPRGLHEVATPSNIRRRIQLARHRTGHRH